MQPVGRELLSQKTLYFLAKPLLFFGELEIHASLPFSVGVQHLHRSSGLKQRALCSM